MKKLKIQQIKVESFVTEIDSKHSETVKIQGGASATVCGKNPCLTVVTFGYWTYCCGDSAYRCEI